MSEQLALDGRGLSKRYGDRAALRGVDVQVRPGTVHGLLGPNGAGKTTLMRVVLGLVRRDAGSVQLLGRPLGSSAQSLPDGVAAVVDAAAFYPYLSGRQNLELLARLDGGHMSRAVDVNDALERTGLVPRADALVAGYSAGMRQRLAIAGALLRAPRLLLLDEPTSSLDPASAHSIRELTRRLADEGAAVVLSSHDMDEVDALCTSITVINHGLVVFSGSCQELRQHAPAAVRLLRTSDDRGALALARDHTGVRVVSAPEGGLQVAADDDVLDQYVVALGRAGIAIRGLERRERSLESLFLELTGQELVS